MHASVGGHRAREYISLFINPIALDACTCPSRGIEEEQDMDARRLVLPEDGYEWRKYGQKFIRNIGKFR